MSQSDFYARLGEELIDNNFDEVSVRERRRDEIEIIPSLMGEVVHLTPSNRKRKRADGSVSSVLFQAGAKCAIMGRNQRMWVQGVQMKDQLICGCVTATQVVAVLEKI